MKRQVEKPQLIAAEVTRKCRYNCRHCRADAGGAPDGDLTTDQWKKIFLSIARFTKCMIILTGGEPLERDDIYELIKYGAARGLRMVLATCGYLINDETIAKLKQAGIKAISFSLDGATPETNDGFRQTDGAFANVIAGAKAAARGGMRFQINTAVSKINAGEMIAIAKLAQQLGAYCFNPFILVPVGRGKEISDAILDPVEYEALLNELLRVKLNSKIEIRVTCGPQFSRLWQQAKARGLSNPPKGCMGGRGFGFVSYRGDVQTCGFLDISAGNLVRNGFRFAKIWRDSELLKNIRNLGAYKGSCGTCEYVATCGGCRARAYSMTGDYLAHDPICDYLHKSKQ